MYKEFLWDTLNFFFQAECKYCHNRLHHLSERYICRACISQIEFIKEPYCDRCGKILAQSFVNMGRCLCRQCQNNDRHFIQARAVAKFKGVMRESIHQLKYYKRVGLSKTLGLLMAEYEVNQRPPYEVIIPVPLHFRRLWQRGFNQAELLAGQMGKKFNLPVVSNSLVRIKYTHSQVGLKKKERLKNILGAFQIKGEKKLIGKSVCLVDDVFTSGATVRECSRVLRESGVKAVYVRTLARG